MQQFTRLSAIPCGASAVVEKIEGKKEMIERLHDLGMIRNTRVSCLFSSAFGDPRAYLVRDTLIAIRNLDASRILCRVDGGNV